MKMNNNHKPVRIKLAHINDTHSYFEPTSLQLKLKVNKELTLEPYVSAGAHKARQRSAQRMHVIDGRHVAGGVE